MKKKLSDLFVRIRSMIESGRELPTSYYPDGTPTISEEEQKDHDNYINAILDILDEIVSEADNEKKNKKM